MDVFFIFRSIPPPPPPLAGNLPGKRIQTQLPEAPACVQNAMMTKDKKPFTYTPGGIDLSQIKSPRMAKRESTQRFLSHLTSHNLIFYSTRHLGEHEQSRRAGSTENFSASSKQYERRQFAGCAGSASNAWIDSTSTSTTIDGIDGHGYAVPSVPNWPAGEQQSTVVGAEDKRKQQKVATVVRAAADGLSTRD